MSSASIASHSDAYIDMAVPASAAALPVPSGRAAEASSLPREPSRSRADAREREDELGAEARPSVVGGEWIARENRDPARWVPLTLTVVVGSLLWFASARGGHESDALGSAAPAGAPVASPSVGSTAELGAVTTERPALLWLDLPQGVSREELEQSLLELMSTRLPSASAAPNAGATGGGQR